MDGCMNRCISRWGDDFMDDKWMDGLLNCWVDGWIDIKRS